MPGATVWAHLDFVTLHAGEALMMMMVMMMISHGHTTGYETRLHLRKQTSTYLYRQNHTRTTTSVRKGTVLLRAVVFHPVSLATK